MPELKPYKYCDVVMKGGITSGIVYPLAIAELAKEYKFKNIGGTSAGAIAAVITAAAEFGRRSGNEDAFSVLSNMPHQLGSNDLMLRLFRPSPKTARAFNTAIAILNAEGKLARFFAGPRPLSAGLG